MGGARGMRDIAEGWAQFLWGAGQTRAPSGTALERARESLTPPVPLTCRAHDFGRSPSARTDGTELVSRCLRVGGVPCECVVGRGRHEMCVCARGPAPVTPVCVGMPRPGYTAPWEVPGSTSIPAIHAGRQRTSDSPTSGSSDSPHPTPQTSSRPPWNRLPCLQSR